MSNQTIKTQVRFPSAIHNRLSEYVAKHGCSMNEAITRLVNDGALMDSMAESEHRQEYIDMINNCLPTLPIQSLKEVCKLAVFLASQNHS